jgi:hypothetical protein
MLILIACWAAILIPALLVGLRILPKQIDGELLAGDRWVIAVWVGVLALALGLMGMALVLPLRPILVGSFLAVSALLAMASRGIRESIWEDLRRLSWGHLLVAGGLLILMAWSSSREVTLFDTGLYHAQMLKLQREFGTIPGGALLHHRLGYNSSWFSLGSIFPAQALGGMVGWVSALHLAGLWRRIRARRGETSDWFAAIAYSLVMPVLWMEGGLMISPSPDTPAALAIIVLAWWGMIAPSNRSERLLLALLAFPLKLSLLPVLVVTGCDWIRTIGVTRRIGQMLQFRSLSLVGPILPIIPILTSYKSSGCPLYPSPVGCLPSLPWAMAPDDVAAIQRMTIDFARDGGRNLPDYQFWTWFPRSFLDPFTGSLAPAALLVIFSMIAICLLTREGGRHLGFWESAGLPTGIAVVGLVYIFLTAPSLRFSIGYLAILPALLLAYWRKVAYPLMAALPLGLILLVPYAELPARPIRLALLLLAAILHGVIMLRGGRGERDTFPLLGLCALLPSLLTAEGTIVRPPPLLVPQQRTLVLHPLAGGGSIYLTSYGPLANQCWDAPVPCTPEPPSPHLRLLRSDVGVQGGFQLTKP